MKKNPYLILPLFAMVAVNGALAQIPRTISFQGVLTDAAGNFVSNGNHTLVLSIYNQPTGGSPLFTETQTVPVVQGIFNSVIGSVTAGNIPTTLAFDVPYYLGVSVDGGPELSPRTPMTSVPYSLRAVTADSAIAADRAINAQNANKALMADRATSADTVLGGYVKSINGQQGSVQFVGAGGTTVTSTNGIVTIASTSTGGIQELVNTDNSIGITFATGPVAVLSVNEGGITTSKLQDGAVTTIKLFDGAVTTQKLADNSVTSAKIIDGEVKTNDLAANAVTAAKISTAGATANGQSLVYNGSPTPIWGNPVPGGLAGGDLAGTYPNPQIAATAGNNIILALNNAATTGIISDARLSTNIPRLNTNNAFTGALNTFNAVTGTTFTGNAFVGGTFSGNGAALNSLNASNISTGTLADARLSTNVPLLNANNVFTGTNTFVGINGASLTLTGKGTSASTATADPGNTLVTKDFVTTAGNVAVLTNASLIGNGQTGTPLGINLANPNTFTATQTLPTTDAQGAALIGSVNSATAATINAARIGNGLTDTQVNDNLTINGGTIDNTPIGATTPSTGAFTTLSATTVTAATGNITTVNATSLNGTTLALTGKGTSASTAAADPGNTLVTKDFVTTPGNVAVSTNASLIGNGQTATPLGINLANPNTFTATQTLPVSAAQGDALIASTNAGTTNIIDARVADNLTINGGTVDNTPIGATTPSTGAFTTINGTSLALTAKGTSASTVTADPGNTLITKDFVTTPGNVAVSTNASLVGNGTTGSPLGINLANPNTFTATQTLPVSAAQGDALIASTNAGTTTINAVRIGNGLTDTQVNDNLTISGGTINNTPIGATTPSTGAFTNISGDGAAITNINASNIATGTLNDARLSTNVPLLNANNTFTGNNTFSNITATGTFTGNGSGLTNLNASNITTGTLADARLSTNVALLNANNNFTGTNTFVAINGTSLALTGKGTSAATLAGDPANTLTTKGYVDGSIAAITLAGDVTGSTGATQINPANAGVGDRLISGVNNGTTTVNAARIGNGLTDTQVNDNLTISGGTVNNTPIGATTPSTGAFTTISGDGAAITNINASNIATGTLNDARLSSNVPLKNGANVFTNSNTFNGSSTFAGATTFSGATSFANAIQVNAAGSIIGTNADAVQLTVNGPGAGATNNTLSVLGKINAAGAINAGGAITGASLALTGKGTSAATLAGDPANTLTTKGYVDGSIAAITLAGDVTGSTGATQINPANAGVGDRLISGVNNGTTTVNAVRIGNGLTDTQVNDNLTISGGTVNNTPIGATTPSTGAFTTINGTSLALTAKGTSASTLTGDAGNTLVTKDFVTTAGNVAVLTNTSLTGNGTTGSPLGINLANANTFTATQTLPVSAAQGDALIASTNAGTTTVNAARIGNGLTDTQVNDNLTISGGTVNNTPIGATTPSTGAFTTINGTSLALTAKGTSASTLTGDAGNTLVTKDFVTTAGNVAVLTNTSLTGNGTTGSPLGINLANANTFTATQTLPVSATQGDALIASTNAGTTTVNAVRIGNGLTDTQVNDNLTISGGTVNNTPIGATTPSTGAFTTINGTSLALTAKGTSASTLTGDAGNTLVTKDFVTTAGNVAVLTNTSLTGNGTTGSPLGINLANANTFTATQTLPVSAAQGDALIASTNAGTTTINAARIGNGLTDTQVNDNLTISGGTINNTPIGATTPSTGVFTTISGNGAAITALNATNIASGTLADARLSANVPLLNANNTFTGNNTFSNLSATGTFTGNGSGLTNLNASNISSGTLADARLSTNVALLNASQTFTGTNTFSSPILGNLTGNVTGNVSGSAGTFTGNLSGDVTSVGMVTTIGANSVTSAKIANGEIVDADINPAAGILYGKLSLNNSIQLSDISTTGAGTGQAIVYNGTNIVWGNAILTGTAGGDLTGTYPNPTIANDAVTSAKIFNGTIVDADISPTASIGYAKLNLANNIVNTDIAPTANIAYSKLNLASSVKSTDISPTGATIIGQALTYNGSTVQWGFPAAAGFAAPITFSLNSATPLLTLSNSGTAAVVSLTASGGGNGLSSSTSSSGAAISATSNGSGTGIAATANGTGNAIQGVTNTAAHAISGVAASGSSGNAVNAQVSGSASGSAGNFVVSNTGNAAAAVAVSTNGATSTGVSVSNTGTSGTGLSVSATGTTSNGVTISATGTGAGGGKGLEITNGRIVLSYGGTVGAGALSNIKSVYDVNDGVGSSAPVVTMPTSTENGQVVYVYVSDPDGATVNSIALAAGTSATFVYVGGAWRRF